MNRLFRAPAWVTCAGLVLGSMTSARAAFTTGTQGLADIGTPMINTPSLATATAFTFGSLLTTAAETGDFANPGSVNQFLGSATLDLNNIGAFRLGTADFGFFTANSVASLLNDANVRAFMVVGTFAPGTRYGANVPTISSAFVVSFTQTSGAGMAISDSGTLSVPASNVSIPEPASAVLLGLGLVALGGVAARRRPNE